MEELRRLDVSDVGCADHCSRETNYSYVAVLDYINVGSRSLRLYIHSDTNAYENNQQGLDQLLCLR